MFISLCYYQLNFGRGTIPNDAFDIRDTENKYRTVFAIPPRNSTNQTQIYFVSLSRSYYYQLDMLYLQEITTERWNVSVSIPINSTDNLEYLLFEISSGQIVQCISGFYSSPLIKQSVNYEINRAPINYVLIPHYDTTYHIITNDDTNSIIYDAYTDSPKNLKKEDAIFVSGENYTIITITNNTRSIHFTIESMELHNNKLRESNLITALEPNTEEHFYYLFDALKWGLIREIKLNQDIIPRNADTCVIFLQSHYMDGQITAESCNGKPINLHECVIPECAIKLNSTRYPSIKIKNFSLINGQKPRMILSGLKKQEITIPKSNLLFKFFLLRWLDYNEQQDILYNYAQRTTFENNIDIESPYYFIKDTTKDGKLQYYPQDFITKDPFVVDVWENPDYKFVATIPTFPIAKVIFPLILGILIVGYSLFALISYYGKFSS